VPSAPGVPRVLEATRKSHSRMLAENGATKTDKGGTVERTESYYNGKRGGQSLVIAAIRGDAICTLPSTQSVH